MTIEEALKCDGSDGCGHSPDCQDVLASEVLALREKLSAEDQEWSQTAANILARAEAAESRCAELLKEVEEADANFTEADAKLSSLTAPVDENEVEKLLSWIEAPTHVGDATPPELEPLARALRQARAALVEKDALINNMKEEWDHAAKERDLALSRLAEAEKVVEAARIAPTQTLLMVKTLAAYDAGRLK